MQRKGVSFSVFTKMWQDKSPTELGEFVRELGFDGIELPVRAGYPVPPESVGRDLPQAAQELRALGVAITRCGRTDGRSNHCGLRRGRSSGHSHLSSPLLPKGIGPA